MGRQRRPTVAAAAVPLVTTRLNIIFDSPITSDRRNRKSIWFTNSCAARAGIDDKSFFVATGVAEWAGVNHQVSPKVRAYEMERVQPSANCVARTEGRRENAACQSASRARSRRQSSSAKRKS